MPGMCPEQQMPHGPRPPVIAAVIDRLTPPPAPNNTHAGTRAVPVPDEHIEQVEVEGYQPIIHSSEEDGCEHEIPSGEVTMGQGLCPRRFDN